jgi:hypothetical protein
MPKLNTLDMQLPNVKTLLINGIGMHWLFDLGIGERGAYFIAQNLKNLTILDIRKQKSDSENNNIGDSGATAIANGLKYLTQLYINK